MKPNRKVILILSLVLSLALATGSTLAYLSDTDADVNVMTLGSVKIKQHEFERVLDENGEYVTVTSDKYGEGYKVQPFTQGKPLFPAVGTVTDWGMGVYWDQLGDKASGGQKVLDGLNNIVDKFVLVENTGKSDAYVRTLIAFEVGSLTDAMGDLVMISHGDFYAVRDIGLITVEGNNYYLMEFTYTGSDARHTGGILPPGEYTYNSLAQIYLRPEATNEDVEALDGNDNGTYDILVVSQAIQTAGFADAVTALNEGFGEITTENHPWAEGQVPGPEVGWPGFIMNEQDAYDSTVAGGEYTLGVDLTTSNAASHFSGNREYAVRSVEYVINLNGHTINHDSPYQNGNGTGYTYLFTSAYNGKLTINGEGTITSENADGFSCIVYAQGPSEVVINGGEYYATRGVLMWAGNNSHITINDGTFISYEANNDVEMIYSSGGVIDIYGGFFHNTGWENRPVNVANANRSTGFINIYGGTFVNFDPSTGGDDPSNIKVMPGYKVVSETQDNGDVWYTVVPE